MKRFVTLILMFTTLLTFTQKVTASAPVLENETVSMANCLMSMSVNEAHMDMTKTQCDSNEMSQNINCQSDCDFMTVVSVLHFIEHENTVTQPSTLLTYQTGSSAAPHYFPESLYRPPFLG